MSKRFQTFYNSAAHAGVIRHMEFKHLCYTVYDLATDIMPTQGASASVFMLLTYRQLSKTSRTESQKLTVSGLDLHFFYFLQYIAARCWVENEDVVVAVPTGDAPTTSEWSTIVLPTKVFLH